MTSPFPYQSEVESIIQRTLTGHRYTIYLFGSRADGTATPTSDIDLAVQSEESLTLALSLAREALSESHIPLTVELVNLAETSKPFKETVLKDGILLWTN